MPFFDTAVLPPTKKLQLFKLILLSPKYHMEFSGAMDTSVAETLKFPFWELNLLIFSSQNLSRPMYEVIKYNSMFYSFSDALGIINMQPELLTTTNDSCHMSLDIVGMA
jgi:hypothetical protein